MTHPDSEYRNRLDGPLENLAVEMFGVTGGRPMKDHEIVEHAAKVIRRLREAVLTVMHENLVKILVEEP